MYLDPIVQDYSLGTAMQLKHTGAQEGAKKYGHDDAFMAYVLFN